MSLERGLEVARGRTGIVAPARHGATSSAGCLQPLGDGGARVAQLWLRTPTWCNCKQGSPGCFGRSQRSAPRAEQGRKPFSSHPCPVAALCHVHPGARGAIWAPCDTPGRRRTVLSGLYIITNSTGGWPGWAGRWWCSRHPHMLCCTGEGTRRAPLARHDCCG